MSYGDLHCERGAALVEYVLLTAIGGLAALALLMSLSEGLRSKVEWMVDAIRNVGV